MYMCVWLYESHYIEPMIKHESLTKTTHKCSHWLDDERLVSDTMQSKEFSGDEKSDDEGSM